MRRSRCVCVCVCVCVCKRERESLIWNVVPQREQVAGVVLLLLRAGIGSVRIVETL